MQPMHNEPMATYVLIPGADGRAWLYSRLAPLLRGRGHHTIAVDLPVTDSSAGLESYTKAVVDAIGNPRHEDLILIAQSLGGFIAPLVAERLLIHQLVLLNGMVPKPGESAGEWWANTGQARARAEYYSARRLPLAAEFDVFEAFFHDAPRDVLQEAVAMGEQESHFDTLFREPWPLRAWPRVPTRFLQGVDDRFFPLAFQRRVVKERLKIPVEPIPGGHLAALSRPKQLAAKLGQLLS